MAGDTKNEVEEWVLYEDDSDPDCFLDRNGQSTTDVTRAVIYPSKAAAEKDNAADRWSPRRLADFLSF